MSGNSTGLYGGGGGIVNYADGSGSATLTLNNSTLSGNWSANSGGGVLNSAWGGSAPATINNSTFSGNEGGAIFNDSQGSGSATLELTDTILNAGDTSGGVIGCTPGKESEVTSHGYNLSSDNSGNVFLNKTTDHNGIDPMLGPLADNGGPTFTHALLPGSPALDQGKNLAALTTDQRGTGFARTFDDPAIANATEGDGTDIGAYEFKDTDGDGVEDGRDNCPSTANPEKIAFASDRDGNLEIYVMDADGMNPMRLTNNATFDREPAFSPDGSRIVFTSFIDDSYEIYVMNADGSNQTRLTNYAETDIDPSFSPDGSKIVFESFRGGNFEIYVMDADGSNQTNLTNNAAFDVFPSFSPDGSKIVFTSNRDGNDEIYVMDADGSNPTRLTNNAAFDDQPSFSPDGNRIVFISNRDGNKEVYVMNADGSNQTNLTNNAADDFESSWGAQADSDHDGIGDACDNTAPTAVNDGYSTNEDTPKNVAAPGVLGNDSDPDGDAITAVLVSGPSHSSSFTLNSNGSFNYTPASNFNGTDTFTYKARDSHNADSNTATVTMTVHAVNDPPVFNSVATITRKQGRSFNAQIATVSDPDNSAGSLVVTVKTPSSGISVTNITNNNGVIKADVAAACNATVGSHTVVLKVSDGAKSSTGNLTVNVIRSDPATLTTNSPAVLQPSPNHSYQNFTIGQMVQSATDDCDGNVINKVVIEKATSDEADNAMGPGDGNTVNDIVIAADCKSVQLRAERDGTKNGRVYQVTLRVYDSSCNATRRNYQVSVPVGNNAAVGSGPVYTVQSSCFGATCP